MSVYITLIKIKLYYRYLLLDIKLKCMKHFFFLFQEIKFYLSYQKVIKNGAFNFSAYKIFFKVNKSTIFNENYYNEFFNCFYTPKLFACKTLDLIAFSFTSVLPCGYHQIGLFGIIFKFDNY